MGGAGGRDLQTNLITSPENGITLLALELLTSQKESEKECESGILKRERVGMGRGDAVLKDWRKFETCHISFSHCSYQGVWFTPEYLGESREGKERHKESERAEEWELETGTRWQKTASR